MDPLEELNDSLDYMFELQAKRPGDYINPLVGNLRTALDNYSNTRTDKLLDALTDALKKALPVIQKYVDSYAVKVNSEALARTHGKSISWSMPSQAANRYTYFKDVIMPTKRIKIDFIKWLSTRTGKDFASLDGEVRVQVLINEKSEIEFITKLKLHLQDNPDFLANLALESPNAFIKLMSSSLGSELEKYQIANAIYHHVTAMPLQGAKELIHYFNEKIFAPHSIQNLLQDPKAKAVLDKSELFQHYQRNESEEQEDVEASTSIQHQP